MQMVLAFPDLRAAGIVQSRTTLNKMIDERGFPPGRIVANRRIWTSVEILDWLHAQPSEKLALKGYAKDVAGTGKQFARVGSNEEADAK